MRQQMESAGVQAAASQQSAVEQIQELHSWAHASLEALRARLPPNALLRVTVWGTCHWQQIESHGWQMLPTGNQGPSQFVTVAFGTVLILVVVSRWSCGKA